MDLNIHRSELYNRFQCIAEMYAEIWLLSESVDDFMDRIITIEEIVTITGYKYPVTPVTIIVDNKAVSVISIAMTENGMPVINTFHPVYGDEVFSADEIDACYLSVLVSLLRGLRYEIIESKLNREV